MSADRNDPSASVGAAASEPGGRTPLSTYRLQLHADFTFDDAAAVAPYLADLGVSHIYLSPILQAARGSSHGYDIVDPTAVDADRGGMDGLERLADAASKHGLRIVADIVPNHLDIATDENRWWRSVLALGLDSKHADTFDVRWEAGSGDRSRVTLPVLGATLPETIADGSLVLRRDGDWPALRYYERSFPLSVDSVREMLIAAAADHQPAQDLADRLPEASRDHELPGVAKLFNDALAQDGELAEAFDVQLERVASSEETMARLVDQQHYKLVLWRKESKELNYRRFFDINTMIGTRVDRPHVFEALHRCTLDLVERGLVHALRVDHPDGLRFPRRYFEALSNGAGGVWVVAEKILEADESLPSDWSVAGTTGYDFLNDALALMIDPDAERPLTELYAERTRSETVFHAAALEAKRSAARELLAADLGQLVDLLTDVAEDEPRLGFDRSSLAEAVALLAAGTPVYRTYIDPDEGRVSDEDRRHVEQAAEEAKRLRPDLGPDPINVIVETLLGRAYPSERSRAMAAEFVVRFQQYSAPVMAKGVEDTAFYRYNRFVALSEVGGDPSRFSLAPDEFHQRVQRRAEAWPAAMLTTATHDTKRSEDVRARLAALSEFTDEWSQVVERWFDDNERRFPEAAAALDDNTEYLLYQTIVGAWPISADRLVGFMAKAAREAKLHTSWRRPNEAYESSMERFVRDLLDDDAFVDEVEEFVAGLRTPGRVNSIVQAVLRLTAPGVPDTYQGSELWDLSLVDPDNRRPVDYDLRRSLLDELDGLAPEAMWRTLEQADDPGRAKLFTVSRLLRIRKNAPEAFTAQPGYEPIAAFGEHAHRALAFARNDHHGHSRLCVVAPRLTAKLDDWGETSVKLPAPASGSRWRNVLDVNDAPAGVCKLSDLLRTAPAAVLVAEAEYDRALARPEAASSDDRDHPKPPADLPTPG